MQAARAVWRKRQAWLVAHPEKIGNIVFIDETGINTKMARLRGRCRRGRRMVASIPHGHWKTMTFIAGLRFDGLTAPWVTEGAMDGDAFEKYIKTQLAPTLQKGDVVVLDNLPAHKRKEAAEAVEERGAWLLFLPPYSPDLNPIDLAFSKFKAHLIRMVPRIIDDLRVDAGRPNVGSGVATEVERTDSGWTACRNWGRPGFYRGLPWLVMTTTRMSVPRLVEVTTRRG